MHREACEIGVNLRKRLGTGLEMFKILSICAKLSPPDGKLTIQRRYTNGKMRSTKLARGGPSKRIPLMRTQQSGKYW